MNNTQMNLTTSDNTYRKPLITIRIRKKLLKNKAYGLLIFLLGMLTAIAGDGDCTCLVFCTMITISLFMARKNYIN